MPKVISSCCLCHFFLFFKSDILCRTCNSNSAIHSHFTFFVRCAPPFFSLSIVLLSLLNVWIITKNYYFWGQPVIDFLFQPHFLFLVSLCYSGWVENLVLEFEQTKESWFWFPPDLLPALILPNQCPLILGR